MILGRCRREQGFNLLFFLSSLYTAAMSGRAYHHYAIVLLPAVVIPFACLFDHTGGLAGRNDGRELRPAVAIASSVLILIGAFGYRRLSSGAPETEPVTAYLQTHTKRDDDVLILGKSLGYYIQADRKTENRFFYQLPPLEISQELRDEFKDELRRHPSDFVILSGDAGNRESIREKLEDVWPVMEEEILAGYTREEYEAFEVYIRGQEGQHG